MYDHKQPYVGHKFLNMPNQSRKSVNAGPTSSPSPIDTQSRALSEYRRLQNATQIQPSNSNIFSQVNQQAHFLNIGRDLSQKRNTEVQVTANRDAFSIKPNHIGARQLHGTQLIQEEDEMKRKEKE